ncbi:hypothetical protein D917_02528 [Trichinella nativa]|uniref:Uncharacterized protein n=1 Tax=Trichinella nativa TaxID=6335 RepID=A0A1Y3E312_9BILA|nr:hypothetical protein D917_02528 [Trichinella nativa]
MSIDLSFIPTIHLHALPPAVVVNCPLTCTGNSLKAINQFKRCNVQFCRAQPSADKTENGKERMESLEMKCFLDWKILSSVKQQRPTMISKKRLWLATSFQQSVQLRLSG